MEDRFERCQKFFKAWRKEVKLGMTSKSIFKVLSSQKIQKDELKSEYNVYAVTVLGGKIPINLDYERSTVFCFHFLPKNKEKNWSDFVIYFSITGKNLKKKDGVKYLFGEICDDRIKLFQFALCSPKGIERFLK